MCGPGDGVCGPGDGVWTWGWCVDLGMVCVDLGMVCVDLGMVCVDLGIYYTNVVIAEMGFAYNMFGTFEVPNTRQVLWLENLKLFPNKGWTSSS